MKIAFVNRMLGITRGGGEIWDLKMAEKLEAGGANVTFYVGSPMRSKIREPIRDFETVEIQIPNLQNLAYAAPNGVGGLLADLDAYLFCRQAASLLKTGKHDLVQICSRPEFARYVDDVPSPVSIVMHGSPYSLWYDVLKPWGSTCDLLTMFDQVIATGATNNAIRDKCDVDVRTVNPGVDSEQFAPGDADDSDTFTILSVGRFVPIKNYSMLIEVYADIAEKYPNSELVLVGNGPLRRRLESQTKKLGVDESVKFPGYVPHQDLPEYYAKADLLAITSRHESFGMTIIEAMSCGTPVVAPRVGVIPEIVEHEKTGILYAVGSGEELSASIESIMLNPELREEYSQHARIRVIEDYDWTYESEKLHRLYQDLIERGR